MSPLLARIGPIVKSDWWFGTFFIFPYFENVIIPIDFHIFQGDSNHQLVNPGCYDLSGDFQVLTIQLSLEKMVVRPPVVTVILRTEPHI